MYAAYVALLSPGVAHRAPRRRDIAPGGIDYAGTHTGDARQHRSANNREHTGTVAPLRAQLAMPPMTATAFGVAIVALQLYPYLLAQLKLNVVAQAACKCLISHRREPLLSRAVGRSRYLTSFPHPYSALTATPTDPSSVARFPPFPPDLSGGAFSRNEQARPTNAPSLATRFLVQTQ